jgi:carbon storage regulator
MLVLCRKLGETIVLSRPDGLRVEIAVVDVVRDKVRLGITAPDDVKIVRSELLPIVPQDGGAAQ